LPARAITQEAAVAASGATDGARRYTGSRNSDGNVPNANWNDGKFNVNWYNPDNRNSNLRARVAVSPRPIMGGVYVQRTGATRGPF